MASGVESTDTGPQARVVLQQCLSAKLMVQPQTEEEAAKYVHVGSPNVYTVVLQNSSFSI